jgi:hypothetical protein
MKLIISIITVLFIFNYIYADGPPVDEDGNISVMHLVFYFDSLQLEHIQYSSYFELNDEQMKVLLKINPLLKREFIFISPFYNDCTCGMTYAIWNKEKSFAIPIYNIFNDYEDLLNEDEVSEIEEYEEKDYWEHDNSYGAYIFIGSDTNLYFNKKRQSIENIYSIIENISNKENKSYRFIMVRKPPKINDDIDNSINDLILRIESAVKKYSIKLQITG